MGRADYNKEIIKKNKDLPWVQRTQLDLGHEWLTRVILWLGGDCEELPPKRELNYMKNKKLTTEMQTKVAKKKVPSFFRHKET